MRKIIPIPCENKIFLAPMEGVNDIAFRILCKNAGCGLTFTGFVSPLCPKDLDLSDNPALQIFGNSKDGIKEFMKKNDNFVSMWDFNLGCPATNAKKRKFGAYMSHELEKIEEILKEMRKNTKKPLCVKIRKTKHALKILKIAEKYCDAISIHPRTISQGYGGEPDLEFAKKIKEKTFLPVIYSGNVNEKNYEEFLKIFDYVMIGRNAIGNPNIFSITSGRKENKFDFKDYLDLGKKYNFPFRQYKTQAMFFTKGKRGSKEKRLEIFKIKTLKELKDFFKKY